MVVDCSVNVDFDIVFSQSLLFAKVDDVRFHVQHMNPVSEGIEILQARPHSFDILPESLVYSCIIQYIPT